jgi:hypothetical protein
MIGDVLVFLRKHLDDHLRVELGVTPDDPTGDKVVFLDGDKIEPITFKLGAVSELLINVEEERVLRQPDLYARVNEDGIPQRVQPDIRLILYVLFVARFKQYESGWEHLSKIIEHFQSHRVFEPHDPSQPPAAETTADLPAGIEKLVVELVTLDFAGQNEVWNALRTTYHPSILYRVKLIALRDRKPEVLPQVTEPPTVELQQTS